VHIGVLPAVLALVVVVVMVVVMAVFVAGLSFLAVVSDVTRCH
jgi:hypothetical protein